MKTPLIMTRIGDWLLPGSPSDSRLFHADDSDRIRVCPPDLGQGYFQEIQLQDDVTLLIHDFSFNHDVVRTLVRRNHLKFEFRLTGFDAGYSFFVPSLGVQELGIIRSQTRSFKIEVIFKQPALTTYAQAFTERLSPEILAIGERLLQAIYRCQGGKLVSTTANTLYQIINSGTAYNRPTSKWQTMSAAVTPNSDFTENILPETLYAEALDLDHIARSSITSEMMEVIGQILSCPYQGATRRTYLECRVLKLVHLRLEAMVKPHISDTDLSCIYQAGKILKKQIANPPTVEELAQKVYTNRKKLYQGFREVYGITPLSYSRNCRLMQARQLLMTSDLSVENIATTVGYTNRSKFAAIFRQRMGINPKAFQMQAWKLMQLNCAS